MKFFKALYIEPRFFQAGIAIVILFGFSYFVPFLFNFSQALILVLLTFLFVDFLILFIGNSRLDSIQAAILNTKLQYLDQYNKARQNAAIKYNEAFKNEANIITPVANKACQGICSSCDCHVFHQYTLKVKNINRDDLVQFLNDNNIPCGVYYPVPLHKQKAYEDKRYNEDDFKVTNKLVKTVISLPMHTELDDEQIEFITTTILNFINTNS